MAVQDPKKLPPRDNEDDSGEGEGGGSGGNGVLVVFRDETISHLKEVLAQQREGHQTFGRIDEASHREASSPSNTGDLSMGSQLQEHPLLASQLLDGVNPDVPNDSPLPANNEEAIDEYNRRNELKLQKVKQLQNQNQNQAKPRPSTPTPRPF